MRRLALALALLLAAAGAAAQTECRSDPQDRDLEFAVGARGDTLEFRGVNPARQLGRVCVLTLDCVVRQPPALIDYFMVPRHAGDPPAVWNIRRVVFGFGGGGAQECLVTATSEPRPPLEAPPPFIPRNRKR